LLATACNTGSGEGDSISTGTHKESLTGIEATSSAQRGLGFVVPDATHWVQQNGCAACHRGGMPLFGGALGAHNGLTVNTTGGITNGTFFGNGTGYLAAWIAGEQCPPTLGGFAYYACGGSSSAQAGYWVHDPGYQLRFSKGGYELWGLAGYTHFSGSTQYLSQVRRGVDWMRYAVMGGDYHPAYTGSAAYTGPYALPIPSSPPYSYRYQFPNDGLLHAGRTTYFLPQDHGSAPTTWNWIQPTAMVASATALLITTDPTLTQVQRDSYNAFLTSLVDSLEGQYVRSNGGYALQDLVYTMIGMHAAGKKPSNNALAAELRDAILGRYTDTAWAEPSLGLGNNALSTGEAIYALCLAGVRIDETPIVDDALDFLAAVQAVDGSWSVGGAITHDIPSTFAALGMACYGILNVEATTTTNGASANSNSGTSQNISFGIDVTNTGYVTNTYNIDPNGCISGCNLTANPPTLTLEPGQTGSSQIVVVLPPGIPASSLIPVTVTTAYTGPNGVVQNTAVVNIVAGNLPGTTALATTTTWVSGAGATATAGNVLNLRASVTRAAGAVTQGSLTFYYGSVAIGTVFADPSTGAFAYNWEVPVTLQGNQSISAVYGGYNNAGLELAGSASTGTLIVNALPPPPAPLITAPTNGLVTFDPLVTVSGSGAAGATLTMRDGSSNIGTLTIPPGGGFSTALTLPYGVFGLTFVQSSSGGTSPATGPITVTVRPPVVTISSPSGGFSLTHRAPSLSIIGSGLPNAAIAVFSNGSPIGSLTADPAGNFIGSISLSVGNHALTFVQSINGASSDAAGPIYGVVTADQDQDGADDDLDNCPTVANADQANLDGDTQGDACDTDDDNDGVADGSDNCPMIANGSQSNIDADAQGDVCDTDDDNDGVADGSDNCANTANSNQANNDGDAQGDLCDADDDNDGAADASDNCALLANSDQANNDGDAEGDACDGNDDNDALSDANDNCVLAANDDQANNDADAEGDACDADDDNDGVNDAGDNCPMLANGAQANRDGDALGDACDDSDSDGANDDTDNCAQFNPDQVDIDGDGRGNLCDNCVRDANPDQADTDNDGIGNVCDQLPNNATPSNDGVGVATPGQESTIVTGNGAATVVLPPGFIGGATPTTVTIAGRTMTPDFRVLTTSGTGGQVISMYDIQIGAFNPYYPPNGEIATVTFVIPYANFATQVDNHTIAISVREPNGQLIMIPNCLATPPLPNQSADGRCTSTAIYSNPFGQQFVRVTTQAFHFSEYLLLDVTPPFITVPGATTIEATGANGAVVEYASSATDLSDGDAVVECSPLTGSVFAIGATEVSCTSIDRDNNASRASFTVNVVDTTDPVLNLIDSSAESNSVFGTVVNYTAAASDIVDGDLAPTCFPASGSVFSLGDTIVYCSVADAKGNSTDGTLVVMVVDTTAPAVTVPATITAEAANASGAAVAYSASALDIAAGNVAVTCVPASGSIFPIGATEVDCSANDGHGNIGSAMFTIEVRDTTAPVVAVPANIAVIANTANGRVVSFATSASDSVNGSRPVSCTQASGTMFAPGETVVRCTSTDSAGNTSEPKSFTVSVTFSDSGVVPPIAADGSSVFKWQRNIPVKFQLTGASAGINNLTARLYWAQVTGGVIGDVNAAESTSPADSGNTFRYQTAAGGHYSFNLSTHGWLEGTYVIRIDLGDGVLRQTQIGIR
jgi:hypothetical protein